MLDLLRAVYGRLTSGSTTEEQAIQSGIWAAGINVGDRILQLCKVVVLARLLSPEAFGLLGIALLVRAALQQFSQLGFDQALIQHRDEDVDAYLNTAWVMKIARGLAIAVVAFVSAPYLASFFGEPRAGPLIRVIGLSPLILGLQNPAVVYFQKNLNFHKEFVYQVGGRVVDLVTAVALALVFRSVWALAVGIVALTLTKLLISYLVHDYRPSVEFDREYASEMFGFGKWMFASAILVFLYSQGDDAFVGWYFGATALGFYQIAYRFSNAPATEVTHVISRVAFPAFSQVQNDVQRLRRGYFRTLQLSSIIGFPMAAGIIAIAPLFVPTVFGNNWEPMVPLLQILALWGGQRALGANVGAVFKAVGRPDFDVKLQFINVVLIAVFIYPAAEQFGVTGVAAVLVGTALLKQPIGFYLVLSLIEGDIKELASLISIPFLASILMAVVVTICNTYVILQSSWLKLCLLIAIGVISYVMIMVVSERTLGYEFVSLYKIVQSVGS